MVVWTAEHWEHELSRTAISTRRATRSTPKLERYWAAAESWRHRPASCIVECRREVSGFFPGVRIARSIPRSRSIKRGRQGRMRSWKAGGIVYLSSGLELDHAWDCELDGGVSQFFVQPLSVNYVFEGKSRTHWPDALIVAADGLEVREVKHDDEASLPENEQRWPIIAETLNTAGISFRVVTEQAIREPIRKGNVEYIRARRRCNVAPEHLVAALGHRTRQIVGESASQVLSSANGLSVQELCAAIRWGLLAVDLDLAPFDGRTVILQGPRHIRGDTP